MPATWEAKPAPTCASLCASSQHPTSHPSGEFRKEEIHHSKDWCASCHMCYLQNESHF